MPFIVLVTRHKFKDFYTTQFDVYVNAETIPEARDQVRTKYPMDYIKFFENGKCLGLVAHFTGEIYAVQ